MKRAAGFFLWGIVLCAWLSGCQSPEKEQPSLFRVLNEQTTGLDFTNHLHSTDTFNLFRYMYFYNGAGVAAGDFNNDGLEDVFFCSNQGNNALYLNEGNLHFKEVSAMAKIPQDKAWNTGVSVVDINNDGLLDIYICRVGKYQMLNSRNQFLICQGLVNGIPVYADKAKEYGLDFSGFSTQAAFLDYDMDGDLDMLLSNHSVHENGTFRPRVEFTGTYHPLAGGRLYRNDGNIFSDVTKEAGINSSAIGYGLGIVVSDINLDGYPDIYMGNDFHENDYLYINQRNGTFKDEQKEEIMHTSQYTMGVDAADINNDGYAEIISMDMLPEDPYILKRSLGEDAYDIYKLKINYGYNYQYSRNNLQYNRRNNAFSEMALYSGIAATDWSWSPLFMDFDNDGLKDLFISNGIPKRMNDIDYINFISKGDVLKRIHEDNLYDNSASLIEKFPQVKIRNKFFRNSGNLKFTDIQDSIVNDKPTYSNGAAYADFDNDGDMDIVVNNIDDPALLYRNLSNDKNTQSYLRVHLKGSPSNIRAVGAKLVLFANGGIRIHEKYPVRGFQSSMDIPLQAGLNGTVPDSVFLVWPDNTFQRILLQKGQPDITLDYKPGLPVFDYSRITAFHRNTTRKMQDITADAGLLYKHIENTFSEFDTEPLIPHMNSTEGPAMAVADINHDGLDDIFAGASAGYKNAVFFQDEKGKFRLTQQPALEKDSAYEDVDACWADVNNDGYPDLIVASGGNQFTGEDSRLQPRLYLNNIDGVLSKSADAFEKLFLTASCVSSCDFNRDGYNDLFIGGRTVPSQYGMMPRSYLLMNDKTGKFKDVTQLYAKELTEAGFVTDAIWFDIDKNGDKDLIVCSEWGTIDAYLNNNGVFIKKILSSKKGWWNFIMPVDVDNDGNTDLVAGNLGLNSRLRASDEKPVRMYVNDFDDNGKNEQVITYFVGGREIPFASKPELDKQIPILRKRFLYAEDFAKASIQEILTEEKIRSAKLYTANYFSNAVLMNKGNLQFETLPLPGEAQLSSYRSAVALNANNDNLTDILLTGNFYENHTELGRYDADNGTVLVNTGGGNFTAENINGVRIRGQARNIQRLSVALKEAFAVAMNNDSLIVLQFSDLSGGRKR